MRRLSVEIPEGVHQQIKAQASLQGMSLREYVLQRLGFAVAGKTAICASTQAETESDRKPRRAEPGSMRELIQNRPWHGTMTKAEIDAYLAGERASWNDD